jgi:hypothetical protein
MEQGVTERTLKTSAEAHARESARRQTHPSTLGQRAMLTWRVKPVGLCFNPPKSRQFCGEEPSAHPGLAEIARRL